MATFRRRPSALREISKNLCNNDESEEMSASPSPSEWIKQVQSQRYTQYDDSNNHGTNQFEFRATNRVQEIIEDNEESEMESDYVETEVSEEEIRNIQVPREREIEIEESESQSDYTSIADESPLYSSNSSDIPSKKNNKNRRQSLPFMNLTERIGDNTHEIQSNDDMQSPDRENKPPAPLSTVNEHKDTDIDDNDSENHCGSMNRTVILTQCFEDTQSTHKHKKQSILPPKELTFDDESPAPPSILRTKKRHKSTVQYTASNTCAETPHFGDIADHLAPIHNLLHTSERRRGIGSFNIQKEDDLEPSPLANTRQRTPQETHSTVSIDIGVIDQGKNKNDDDMSSYYRKHTTKTGRGVMDSLDKRMQRLKQILPSPALDEDNTNNTTEEAVKKGKNKRVSTIRRRSARLAQKRGNVQSSEEEEISMDLSNVSTRNRRKKASKGHKIQQENENENEHEYDMILPPNIEDVEERPYIDDDNVLLENPPLPSTGKRKKKPMKQSNKQEEDEDDQKGNIESIKRRTLDVSMRTGRSNRSNRSNVSDKSSSSVSRRTRTLRSRKEDTLSNIASPISDNNSDYGTFGTPKKDRLLSKRSRKGGSKKRKKSPKPKKQTSHKKTKALEVHDDGDDLNVSYDDYDGMDDIGDVLDVDDDDDDDAMEDGRESPNINENDDEKQEMEMEMEIGVTQDDIDDVDDDGDVAMITQRRIRSHSKEAKGKSAKGKKEAPAKKTKKKKKKDTKKSKKKKGKTRKDKNETKSRKTRKRKASETELSDSEIPVHKRRRLSQYLVKPTEASEQDGCRRSKRVRFKPMAFWASERVEYTPTPLTTGKELMITGLEDRLIPQNLPKQKRIKKKTSKRKSKKKNKKGKAATPSPSPSPAIVSEDDDEEEATPFNGNAWIYDPNTDQMSEKCVAKTDKSLKLVPLSVGNENNNNNEEPTAKRVRGAKGLEEEAFSCGVLEIPPESQKHAEVSYFTEQFFVHQAEKKKLLFKVGDESEFYLSRGSMFYVPPENEYSLINLSKTVAVKLIFTLIKNGHRQEEDTQTQVTTQNTP